MGIERPGGDSPENRAARLEGKLEAFTQLSLQRHLSPRDSERLKKLWADIPEADRPIVTGKPGRLTPTEQVFRDLNPEQRALRGLSPKATAELFIETIWQGTMGDRPNISALDKTSEIMRNLPCEAENERNFAAHFREQTIGRMIGLASGLIDPTSIPEETRAKTWEAFDKYRDALSSVRESAKAGNNILDSLIDTGVVPSDSPMATVITMVATELSNSVESAPSKVPRHHYAREWAHLKGRLNPMAN